jgi:hypothetical protein
MKRYERLLGSSLQMEVLPEQEKISHRFTSSCSATKASNQVSSMVWYTRDTDVLAKVYEKVNKRLKEQQQNIDRLISLRDRKAKTSAPGDTIDV